MKSIIIYKIDIIIKDKVLTKSVDIDNINMNIINIYIKDIFLNYYYSYLTYQLKESFLAV